MQIGIVGLGLIGGSLAKAIKAYTPHRVLGFDKSEQVMEAALLESILDGALVEKDLSACQVVFIALYPRATVDYVLKYAPFFGQDTVVVDCCGVKGVVCGPCEKVAQEYGFTFIGGHPMAGIERSGFAFSKPDLFQEASMILTPKEQERPHALERVCVLCRELGFGQIRLSTPQEHDRMVALTSQLAHVLSSAYVKSPAALNHDGFSAGSFKDMTRVAWLNEDMWAELFFYNQEPLLNEIEGLIRRLKEYEDALQTGDQQKMRQLLQEGRERKEQVG